jgi:hypothetical protein
LGTTTATLKWRRGNGDYVIVVMKPTTNFTVFPLDDGTNYNANSIYPTGDAALEGSVVYKGTGNTVNVTGLTTGTWYYFVII